VVNAAGVVNPLEDVEGLDRLDYRIIESGVPDMKDLSRYVAETDESGKVVWLWQMQEGYRTARPVRNLSQLDQRLQDATIYGASLESVTDWLKRARLR
jgi:hypothetical protein